ncbi:MAG: hypothetical protein OCD02_16565 [Spirochaetaceae bacterium]
MIITFELENISDLDKNTIIDKIKQDKIDFETYFSKIGLQVINDPFEYEIIIRDKIFGFINEGFMIPETKQIIFYGLEDLNIISHEWTHAAFPNSGCERHSEGLAIYIQMQLGKFHFDGFTNPLQLVNSYMFSPNKEKVEDWLNYIKNSQNFYDSRWGRMLMSRALSTEFVNFLIKKHGIERYLTGFYNKLRHNSDFNWLEDLEFVNFLQSLPKSSPTLMEPFFELKAGFIKSYANHFIPKTGSVLQYLIVNKNRIDPKEYNYLQNVAVEDLRTTLYFYS